ETAVTNEMTVRIPWEDLRPGPVGEYVAVVDEDSDGARLHPPVDLDGLELLAQNGLPPSDGNPQFRQQMLYAVAMKTIRNFERALGRAAHWAPLETTPSPGRRGRPTKARYRRQLRLYPHAMAQGNAHYFRDKGVLFGYFESESSTPFPGTAVFTCLSQD